MTQTNNDTSKKLSWKQKLKGLLNWLLQLRRTQDTCGDLSDIQTLTTVPTSNILRSIKDITLDQFISCSVDGDLSVLGTGTPQELQLAWYNLQSQYYIVRGDDRYVRYVAISAEMSAISWRAIYIDYCLFALEKMYVKGVCDLLREDFPKFKFTTESYKIEMGYVRSMEKRNLLRMEELTHEYEQMQKLSSGHKSTREDYVNLLLDINKNEGASYNLSVSVEIFALCMKRLERDYQNIKKNGAR
jgi:hypothetical protein